jgi:Fur family transcriptional regulator, ferric uptake regulator
MYKIIVREAIKTATYLQLFFLYVMFPPMKKKCCDHALTENKAKDLLVVKGLNRTKIKTNLLIELSQAKNPFSVAELHKKTGGDISTIFRTMTQFKEKDLVRELNLGEGFFRYELQDHQDSHHHHHVRCRVCGVIKLIDRCEISIFEKMIARLGFEKMEHYLEFTGICQKCTH